MVFYLSNKFMQNQDANRDKALDNFRNPSHPEHPDNRDNNSGDPKSVVPVAVTPQVREKK